MLSLIGGTGPEGLGLAARLAMAGEEVVIGSRSRERALEAAARVREMVPDARVQGAENLEAALSGDVVFLTVPFEAQVPVLNLLREALEDKILVDVINAIAYKDGVYTAIRVEEGSAAERAQKIAPGALVVSAFKNMSSERLLDIGRRIECDVLVCSDHEGPKRRVMALAEEIEGVRALDGGRLGNSRYLEDITVLLLDLNRRFKAQSCIRIVGL